MSKLAADSQTSSAKVLHATLNDGKIYFKSVQGTSQYVIIFFFGTLNVIFCALLQIQPLLGTQSPDTQGSERQWVGFFLAKCKR